jgi:tyrosyl-tRNA synthetase
MDVESRLEWACKPPVEEVLTRDEMRQLLETNDHPRHYIGFEISGMPHVGSLVMVGNVINNLAKAGCSCRVFLADWHTVLNNKFGGDWEKISRASNFYEEAFKFYCPGVEIVRGTELYSKTPDYWKNVVEFSRRVTLARATRCLAIMGRTQKDALSVAQFIYPSMQSVDIKAMDIDVAHAGTDQRKVHVLARETFPKLGWKPFVAVHNHLLPGLSEPPSQLTGFDEDSKTDKVIAGKMSKSKPESCVFIKDSEEEIREKLKKAFCPPKIVEGNPVVEFAEYLVFAQGNKLEVKRPEKFGGDATYESASQLKSDFSAGKLHPSDLKTAVGESLVGIVNPIRKHFEKPGKKELLQVFEEALVTR